MTEPITLNPYEWSLTGNIIPAAIAALADTSPFTGSHTTLTILTAATIDGYSLKRLKIQPSW
jgi:hypothetical protein